MRTTIRPGVSSGGPSGGNLGSYPKIKQGFIVDSGGEIILDSNHLAASGALMKKENQIFVIKIEPRCKCGLHNRY